MLVYYFDAITTIDEVTKAAKAYSSASDTSRISALGMKMCVIVSRWLSAVFDIDEAALKTETTKSPLSKHPDVQKLLGKTKTVMGHQNDAESFSESLRPYMDSMPAVHGDSGIEFAAWPLIKVVHIFIKSDVLKNGIALVDLPGLADSVESRGRVVKEYFAKLSVTAIVAPIARALKSRQSSR